MNTSKGHTWCRAAIAAAPNDFAVSVLSGNLGALLLSAGRLPEALEELEITIQIGGRVGKIAEAHTAGEAERHNPHPDKEMTIALLSKRVHFWLYSAIAGNESDKTCAKLSS